ncbi:hypothetical protein [Blastococcus sp. SYSU D01042]
MPTDAVPSPGSLTVPPFTGWEVLGVALVVVLLLAVGFLLVGALAPDRRRRSDEWQAFLDGRSRVRSDPGAPARTPAPERAGPDVPHGHR